jgi:hypothetical protein
MAITFLPINWRVARFYSQCDADHRGDAKHHRDFSETVGSLEAKRRIPMKNDIHFWAATLVRGALALSVGSAVMIVPAMAQILLLLPFAVAISILCLAAYGFSTA